MKSSEKQVLDINTKATGSGKQLNPSIEENKFVSCKAITENSSGFPNNIGHSHSLINTINTHDQAVGKKASKSTKSKRLKGKAKI